MKSEIVITEDGSSSIYLPELEEHYHSFHGAIQESEHVFVKNGLTDFLDANEVSILENELDSIDNQEDNAKIFGMPKNMFENLLVQVLSPHAEKIIGGLMKKESA